MTNMNGSELLNNYKKVAHGVMLNLWSINMNREIKILCTLGPASMSPEIIKKLDNMGVDIFRINLSHTNECDIDSNIQTIQGVTAKPICIDTEGAQIRSGLMQDREVRFEEGSIVKIHREDIMGDTYNLHLKPGFILEKVEIGDLISVDFDNLLLKVCEKELFFIKAEVMCAGCVGSNKAVTIDRRIELPALSPKDLNAIEIALRRGVEYTALSFTNKKEDILQLRDLVKGKIHIISKIESQNGLNNLDSILSVSDSILIDRGDLSREVALELIPFWQKKIIQKAKDRNIPVYVATNLLESMVSKKNPTRAEVNDVINTLMDGANGLVLASETAIGSYVVECLNMVKRLIKAYKTFSDKQFENFKERELTRSLILAEPHGGSLINRTNFFIKEKGLINLKKMVVDETVLNDAEQIAIGTYSPIEGFMTRIEIQEVLERYKLPNGVIWTLPIVLQVQAERIETLKIDDEIALVSDKDGLIYAVMHLEDIYEFDFKNVSRLWYGTSDLKHPGVMTLKEKGGYFLGGKVELVKKISDGFERFRLTPLQARHIFERKGWGTVAGFHTRNVIHRAHEYLQLSAMERFGIDGLFVHPVIGYKKKFDFTSGIILKSYEIMLEKYYPKNKVVLGAFLTFSRYAGPREAVFTALCRKNFGCTHFIVGRDHTGVHEFYEPDAGRKLFEKLGDIGIKPIFFGDVNYCRKCEKYVEECIHGVEWNLKISGTRVREMFNMNEIPPEWLMRREIAEIVMEEIRNGKEVLIK